MRIHYINKNSKHLIHIWETDEPKAINGDAFGYNHTEHQNLMRDWLQSFKAYEIKPEFVLEIMMAAHIVHLNSYVGPRYLDLKSAAIKGIILPFHIIDRIEIIKEYVTLKPNNG